MNSNYTARYFYIYRLSEVKALPETPKQLSFALTWGGMNSGEKEVSETPTVIVKDLSQLEPLATIVMPESSQLTVTTSKTAKFTITKEPATTTTGPRRRRPPSR